MSVDSFDASAVKLIDFVSVDTLLELALVVVISVCDKPTFCGAEILSPVVVYRVLLSRKALLRVAGLPNAEDMFTPLFGSVSS
jgi:hypothetical protein